MNQSKIEELRTELRELSARQGRQYKLDAMLRDLDKRERELGNEEYRLKTILDKEEADVERLEKVTLTSIFHTITGQKKTKLTQEQQEAYASRLKYEAVLKELEDCKTRRYELRLEKADLVNAAARYDLVFAELQELMQDDPRFAEQLCELEKREGEASAHLKEIDEAISAGRAALNQIDRIEQSLGSAESWGKWDLFGGGLIADMAKHSHLDSAQAHVEHLQVLLGRFRTELADVKMDNRLDNVNIEGFHRFADYFFDGVIADWSVLSRIQESQDSVHQVKRHVEHAMSKLSKLRTAYAQEQGGIQGQISSLVARP